MDQTEQNLFVLLASSVLYMKGAIECDGKYLRKYDDGKITYSMSMRGGHQEYSEAEPCVFALLHALKRKKINPDNVVFYPSCNEDTGTTWRFLKIDMSFLRIVLSQDKDVLKHIVNRIASIVFAKEKTQNSD